MIVPAEVPNAILGSFLFNAIVTSKIWIIAAVKRTRAVAIPCTK